MVFSSAIFLFAFLPITCILYYICPNIRVKNGLLIIASLVFYAFGEPICVFLMIGSILINYILAVQIASSKSIFFNNKFFLIAAVIFNIGMLVVFKYSALLVTSVNALFHTGFAPVEIRLPIGISFYTFQALSYCIDVYRDKDKVQKSLFKLMLYISFFPQLIAGPIVKYHDIEKQLSERRTTWEDTAEGISRFIFGLSKKLLLANNFAELADTLFLTDMNMAVTAWLASIAYTLQIYFDFSGYSDMAIGLGKMFGFRFQENFNYPYISSCVQDFWRRWHISLSTWFREYLYIPLGGNRRGERRTALNRLIVFACTGIWHGANWTFLVWGLFHGLFITIENKKWPLMEKIKSGRISRHVYTMLVVIIGWVIFRSDSIGQAGHIICSMFAGWHTDMAEYVVIAKLATPYMLICLAVGIALCMPVSRRIKQNETAVYILSAVLLFMCMVRLATQSYNPFIYFRF